MSEGHWQVWAGQGAAGQSEGEQGWGAGSWKSGVWSTGWARQEAAGWECGAPAELGGALCQPRQVQGVRGIALGLDLTSLLPHREKPLSLDPLHTRLSSLQAQLSAEGAPLVSLKPCSRENHSLQ